MSTNLHIDDALLDTALRVGKLRTKRETVDQALREYIARRRRKSAVEAFGSIAMDPGYDYRKARRRR